jgi:hypothetical protein
MTISPLTLGHFVHLVNSPRPKDGSTRARLAGLTGEAAR